MQWGKVNMDKYQCYLTARVRIVESSGQDLYGEGSFILLVHHSVSQMETLVVAHLVAQMTWSPSPSIPD